MSSETLKGLEPSAWRTHHDEPMLFPTFDEAAMYCDDEEPPEPLYAATAINAWIAELVQQRDRAEQQLKQVLWDDPESAPSFGPAFGDLLSYLNRQEPFPSDLYAMMASGSRLWLQMKDKLSTIEQQRDELQLERDNYKSVAEAHSGAFQECIRLREQRDDLLAALKHE